MAPLHIRLVTAQILVLLLKYSQRVVLLTYNTGCQSVTYSMIIDQLLYGSPGRVVQSGALQIQF